MHVIVARHDVCTVGRAPARALAAASGVRAAAPAARGFWSWPWRAGRALSACDVSRKLYTTHYVVLVPPSLPLRGRYCRFLVRYKYIVPKGRNKPYGGVGLGRGAGTSSTPKDGRSTTVLC